jgi:hypothetical protein
MEISFKKKFHILLLLKIIYYTQEVIEKKVQPGADFLRVSESDF